LNEKELVMNIESLSNYKMAQYQYAYGVKMAKNAAGYGKTDKEQT